MRLLTQQWFEATEYVDVQPEEAERDIPPARIQRLRSALPELTEGCSH